MCSHEQWPIEKENFVNLTEAMLLHERGQKHQSAHQFHSYPQTARNVAQATWLAHQLALVAQSLAPLTKPAEKHGGWSPCVCGFEEEGLRISAGNYLRASLSHRHKTSCQAFVHQVKLAHGMSFLGKKYTKYSLCQTPSQVLFQKQ